MKRLSLINDQQIALCHLVIAMMSAVIGAMLPLTMGPEESLRIFSLVHGLLMIFFMLIPACFGGFATLLVPRMIGSDKTSFPQLPLMALGLLSAGFLLLVLTCFFVSSPQILATLMVLIVHLAVLAALFLAINLCITIITRRAVDIGFATMAPFVWAVLVACFMMIALLPMLAAMVGFLFWEGMGGNVSSAHYLLSRLPMMMWFLTHPEYYMILLPALGIVSQAIICLTRRPLYGAKMVYGGMVAFGVVGFILWGQTLFGSKAEPDMQRYFLLTLPVMGLPVAVILTSWSVTIWQGAFCWQVPMLWAMGFIFMLLTGALSGVGLAVLVQPDLAAVASHFHYILALSSVFACFCGWYLFFPTLSGYVMGEGWGKLHFWLMFVAAYLIFLPPYFAGFRQEPGFLFAHIDAMIGWRNLATLGGGMVVVSLLVFFYAIFDALVRKRRPLRAPWTGAEQEQAGQEQEWLSPPSSPEREGQQAYFMGEGVEK